MLREKHDLSLEKLAEKVDSTKSLLWRYENGKSEPGLTALISIAEYFGVTLDWLSGNGDINDVQYSNKKAYSNAINKCIKEEITPEKLEQIIDIMKR
jgi:transcriptional regulator with XRE-family HTH domain